MGPPKLILNKKMRRSGVAIFLLSAQNEKILLSKKQLEVPKNLNELEIFVCNNQKMIKSYCLLTDCYFSELFFTWVGIQISKVGTI